MEKGLKEIQCNSAGSCVRVCARERVSEVKKRCFLATDKIPSIKTDLTSSSGLFYFYSPLCVSLPLFPSGSEAPV